jgi:F0F1-type ATP synthase membrane subunit b/b'
MPRSYKVFGFVLVLLLGVYGCSRGPTSTPAETATAAKVQRLEEDYKAAVAARDQFRQRLTAAEEQHTKAQRELEQAKKAAAAEREALKSELKARTTERDALNGQFETFRKTLKELLGTAETSVGALNLPAPKPAADQGAQK